MWIPLAFLMAWAGWAWWSPLTTEWWLAELPATVLVVGWLIRDRAEEWVTVIVETTPTAPRSPWRGGGELADRSRPESVPVRHADFLPPGVVSLDEWRDRPGRKAA